RTALIRANMTVENIDHVIVQNQIPSVHRWILKDIGVPERKCKYFGGHGHMSSLDTIFALRAGATRGDFRHGDRILLLAAGLGYTASAIIIEWAAGTRAETV